jgi:hypothetical protein
MSEFEIDFEWPVAAKYGPYFGRIVAVPDVSVRNHRPKAETMERAVKVLIAGLGSKKTPFQTVALKIVHALGSLSGSRGGDAIAAWQALAEQLRLMFEGKYFVHDKEYTWPQPEAQHKGDLGIYLVPGKDNRPVLALRPNNLQQALILYAARMIATGTTFNICENCKTSFLSGGARGRNKRGDARFCSSECRWRHHNEEARRRKHK